MGCKSSRFAKSRSNMFIKTTDFQTGSVSRLDDAESIDESIATAASKLAAALLMSSSMQISCCEATPRQRKCCMPQTNLSDSTLKTPQSTIPETNTYSSESSNVADSTHSTLHIPAQIKKDSSTQCFSSTTHTTDVKTLPATEIPIESSVLQKNKQNEFSIEITPTYRDNKSGSSFFECMNEVRGSRSKEVKIEPLDTQNTSYHNTESVVEENYHFSPFALFESRLQRFCSAHTWDPFGTCR